MRILVCGGRKYDNETNFDKEMVRITASIHVTLIIHGDYYGADTLAKAWAKRHGIQDFPFPADWKKHGPAAGPIRNQQMLDEGKPELVIAFPGDIGTADMCRRARKAGIPVITVK